MLKAATVIVNPAAGGGKAGREWPSISRELQRAGLEHSALMTREAGDAVELCRQALRDGSALVIAAGGDGTLNEVVNGWFEAGGDGRPVAPAARLGILPLGTGSDFARAHQIGSGLAAVPTLVTGESTRVDVGQVDFVGMDSLGIRRYFLNVADLGLGADTAHRVRHSSRVLGPFITYLIGAIRAILAHHPQPITVQIDGGAPITRPMGMVAIANSRYTGGGMLIAPGAVADDGLFDVLTLAGTSRLRLLFDLLPRVYRGTHLGHPAVHMQRARQVRVTSQVALLLELDGEQIGQAPATFSILPAALQLVVPQEGVKQATSAMTQEPVKAPSPSGSR